MKTKILLASFLAAAVACAADSSTKPPADTAPAARSEAEEQEVSFLDRYIDLSTELAFYSAYVWRGQILFDRPVWQPAQNIFVKLTASAA